MKSAIRFSIVLIAGAALIGAAQSLNTNTDSAQASHRQTCEILLSDSLSWEIFCQARGYDPHTKDEEIINEFLDTWVGSVEEEKAFNHLKAQ